MRLTKREKEIIANLIQNEIEVLTSFITKKQTSEIRFGSTRKHIQELANILNKIKA
ncbi:hypothetical protein [Thermoanaerobacter sp. YS13]|uniref:hypothetical protein n=1 Tax=Thermoanaerobacter sp. YS13 TaxID=1511746 RepID=UPI000A910AEF|nr:hypothetical protein [Thermoanaerobacter sp. YS13]